MSRAPAPCRLQPCGRLSSIPCSDRSPRCPASGRSWRLWPAARRRQGATHLVDLLVHLPTGAIDRRARPKLRDVARDGIVTISVTVDRHRAPPPNRPRAPYQVFTSDETGDLTLVYFKARADYLQKLLPVGERRIVSGTVASYDGMLQMVHPDRVVSEAELDRLPLLDPVYPLTEGLSSYQVGRAMDAALSQHRCPNGRTRHG